MKSLIFIIALVLPAAVIGQGTASESNIKKSDSVQPAHAQPVTVRGGNVIRAMYEVDVDSSGDERNFELKIHTYSYREALRPFDHEALITVDGLGKVFKVKSWTSRCISDQVRSSIIIRLDKEEFQSIGYAGTVGLKIGLNTFYLPYHVRHYIRQTALKMNSGEVCNIVFYNPGSKENGIRRVAGEHNEKEGKLSKSGDG